MRTTSSLVYAPKGSPGQSAEVTCTQTPSVFRQIQSTPCGLQSCVP
jgi:hypothetical protein